MTINMGLEELRARMEEIKDSLTELSVDDQSNWEQIKTLQYEGRRLAKEYIQIRKEQNAAVSFAEELICFE